MPSGYVRPPRGFRDTKIITDTLRAAGIETDPNTVRRRLESKARPHPTDPRKYIYTNRAARAFIKKVIEGGATLHSEEMPGGYLPPPPGFMDTKLIGKEVDLSESTIRSRLRDVAQKHPYNPTRFVYPKEDARAFIKKVKKGEKKKAKLRRRYPIPVAPVARRLGMGSATLTKYLRGEGHRVVIVGKAWRTTKGGGGYLRRVERLRREWDRPLTDVARNTGYAPSSLHGKSWVPQRRVLGRVYTNSAVEDGILGRGEAKEVRAMVAGLEEEYMRGKNAAILEIVEYLKFEGVPKDVRMQVVNEIKSERRKRKER
jgi:hypothetical protein